MANTHRIRLERPTNTQGFARSRAGVNPGLADRRLGGMILMDYLFDLFAASPFEVFSRLSVLSVLDEVKKDKTLFPDGVKTADPRPEALCH